MNAHMAAVKVAMESSIQRLAIAEQGEILRLVTDSTLKICENRGRSP